MAKLIKFIISFIHRKNMEKKPSMIHFLHSLRKYGKIKSMIYFFHSLIIEKCDI